MDEYKKLPFLWKITNNGTVSHAIGTWHAFLPQYEQIIKLYLRNKKLLLLEYLYNSMLDENLNHSLDAVIARAAIEKIISIKELETAEEKAACNSTYNKVIASGQTTRTPYNTDYTIGDEEGERQFAQENEELLERVLTPEEYEFHKSRNTRMAERSLPFLAQPCLIAVGLYHFLTSGSLLDIYKQNGMTVQRIWTPQANSAGMPTHFPSAQPHEPPQSNDPGLHSIVQKIPSQSGFADFGTQVVA